MTVAPIREYPPGHPLSVKAAMARDKARTTRGTPRVAGRRALLKTPVWYGWKGWVVPSALLRDFINDNEYKFRAEMEPTRHSATDDDSEHWRGMLSERIGAILGVSADSAVRRLYGVLSNESMATNAPFAEAICFALNLYLDSDTDIPTLPGSTLAAKDLIEVRAELAGATLNDLELWEYQKKTLRLSALICKYPRHASRLQDMAPFDCLRPTR